MEVHVISVNEGGHVQRAVVGTTVGAVVDGASVVGSGLGAADGNGVGALVGAALNSAQHPHWSTPQLPGWKLPPTAVHDALDK